MGVEVLPSGARSKEFDPDFKFRKRGRGDLLHPACCAACGNGNCDDGYIDLAVFYDFEGQLYLCLPCVNNVAEVAGLLNDTEIRFLQALNEDLATKAKHLEEAYEAANERLQHYDAIFSSVNGSTDSNVISSDKGESEVINEPSNEGTREGSGITESSEGEGLTESLRVERDNDGNTNAGLNL